MKKLSRQERSEKEHFDRMSKSYDNNYGYTDQFTKYKILRKVTDFKKFVKSHNLDSKLSILEIGCGTGEYTKYIAKSFPSARIVALDISPDIVDTARKKLKGVKNVSFVVDSAYKTKFKNHKFDIICGFYILHHLDLNKFSKEFYRLIKREGLGFFYEPNLLNPIVFLIKSTPFLKRLAGDSPHEWALNPLALKRTFPKGSTSYRVTDFVLPLKSVSARFLKVVDKLSDFVSYTPFLNLMGGSVQVKFKNFKNVVNPKKTSRRMSEYLLERFNNVEKIHWWWEGRREFIRSWIVQNPGNFVLDVGCGTGETMTFIKSFMPRSMLYGIDTSKKALDYTRSRGHKRVRFSSGTKLPFSNKKFDKVLFLDVLEHIQDDLLAIKEAKRVLKRGGIIIITAPALSFIWSEHDSKQGHKRRYNIGNIKSLAKEADLEILKLTYFNMLLALPIIFIRLVSRINFLNFLSSYDNSLNYDVAFNKPVNSILRTIFVGEIKLLRFFNFPLGISIGAVLKKR